MTDPTPRLPYGRLALASVGAATAVLLLTTGVVAVVRPSGVWALVIVLVGVAGTIAAMSVVSARMTRRLFGAVADGDDPGAGPGPRR